MRILVACEESATVRDALRAVGHDAWSCDLRPTRGDPTWHIQADALAVLHSESWRGLIAHPPCTFLAVSGNRWHAGTQRRLDAAYFAEQFLNWNDGKSCVEQPVSALSSIVRKSDQTIQPWMFGHGETKATCLWLRGLPLLKPTSIVSGRAHRIHRMPPSPDRAMLRSVTYPGIAAAMAAQWFL